MSVYSALRDKVDRDDIILPTLPEMAIEIVKAFDTNKLIDSTKVSAVIIKDPAVAARIIKIANSAYIGSPIRINTLKAAVTRIGLHKIRNIVIAVVMEQLFISKKIYIKRLMHEDWKNKINITCAALALHEKSNIKDSVGSDEVLLYCLLADIGILPVFLEFDKHEEVYTLENIRNDFHPLIHELTNKILNSWGFDSFAAVYDHDRTRNSMGLPDLYKVGQIHEGLCRSTTLENFYNDALGIIIKESSTKTRATELKAMFA